MKLGKSIKCYMRNIFPEISCIKCGEQTSPRPFSKKPKMTISFDQQPEDSWSFF